MNTIINPAPSLPRWPLMMISKDEDVLVMFSAPSTGMAIACNSESNSVGEYCNTWDMDAFIPFTGSVTIKAVNGK